ncbi:MAG: hypothetical protein KY457_08995 [Actinobacteria bacterium]|nr:hypothetical protein [Actinomycetota bacterium]
MRRLVQTLSLAIASLVLLAVPALAAGEEEPHVTQQTGFGTGMWDGLLLALVFAVIIGLVVFIESYAGREDEAMPRQEGLHH